MVFTQNILHDGVWECGLGWLEHGSRLHLAIRHGDFQQRRPLLELQPLPLGDERSGVQRIPVISQQADRAESQRGFRDAFARDLLPLVLYEPGDGLSVVVRDGSEDLYSVAVIL